MFEDPELKSEAKKCLSLLRTLVNSDQYDSWDVGTIVRDARDEYTVYSDERSCELLDKFERLKRENYAAKLKQLVLKPPFVGAWIPAVLKQIVTGFGQQCFRLEWDSGGPGAGAGTNVAYQFGKHYFAIDIVTYGLRGPYPSLEEALPIVAPMAGGTLIVLDDAVTEIECSEWSDDELIRRFDLSSAHSPPQIVINGSVWYFEQLEQLQAKQRSGGS